MRHAGLIGPIILIAIGGLFLLNNIGFHVPLGVIFRDFWPFLLIILGVLQLSRAAVGGPAAHGSLTGGIVLITMGSLFALQTLFNIRFGQTWPILLIAVGAAGLIRFNNGTSFGRGGFRR